MALSLFRMLTVTLTLCVVLQEGKLATSFLVTF